MTAGWKYYELTDNVYIQKRWHLDNPVDTEGNILYRWPFSMGIPLDVSESVIIPVSVSGRPLDFSECGVGYPVIHARVMKLLKDLDVEDVQYIPVKVMGFPDDYVILNATRLIPCVDEARCEYVARWTEADGFPEKIGDYFRVQGLRIDASKVGEARIFRPKGWRRLIVREEIKDAFEREQVLGPKYFEV